MKVIADKDQRVPIKMWTDGVPVEDALFTMAPNVKRVGAVLETGGRIFSEGAVRVAVEVVVDDFDKDGDGDLADAETEEGFLALQKRMELKY